MLGKTIEIVDGNASVDPTQDNDDTDDLVETLLQQTESKSRGDKIASFVLLILGSFWWSQRFKIATYEIEASCSFCSLFLAHVCILSGKLASRGFFIFIRKLHLTCEHFLDLLDFNAIDDMRRRMDGVEKSVYDLRAELGGGNAPPSVPPDAKYDPDDKYDFEPPRYI
ncbi:hypothetical protein V6N11_060815 [Hibiscus sabdariffa]|uniref:Uncharacterized protein n=1 Tax=Hibiscus sabdariffa TaxID=183260 RepID=A0ABR2QRF8_9ROSI